MSFAPEFDSRWVEIIEPLVSKQLKLKANRVDYNLSGESIVFDIMDGIAHARLVIADITSTQMSDVTGTVWPQRNGNVMWELGIAHTMRVPNDVLVIRSDNQPSIFDLTQFRAFTYDPTQVGEALHSLEFLAQDRLRATKQDQDAYVTRCAGSLDPASLNFLLSSMPFDGREFTITSSLINVIGSSRLFELGLIRISSVQGIKAANENDSPVEVKSVLSHMKRGTKNTAAMLLSGYSVISSALVCAWSLNKKTNPPASVRLMLHTFPKGGFVPWSLAR
ncbi:MAG: hypothetical protein H0T92_21830 [Pyrinomonadaceae bacterium]|nr:hypothetical protein [Pyrinomonadaceae bacterium]